MYYGRKGQSSYASHISLLGLIANSEIPSREENYDRRMETRQHRMFVFFGHMEYT